MDPDEPSHTLPTFDAAFAHQVHSSAGLKPLNPIWAKLEIILGLIVAVLGTVLLRDHTTHDALSGALIVLGLYLVGAGHRSHLYQSQNRQTAFLIQCLRQCAKPQADINAPNTPAAQAISSI